MPDNLDRVTVTPRRADEVEQVEMLPEGGMSASYCPVTERFLRYDPARGSVDYIAYVEEFMRGWSLEGATEVSDDFAADFNDSWPAIIFQHLIEAYPALDVYPLSQQQAQDMGWSPYAEDQQPPSLDHLWRPVDLSER
jgi:hypothetical protein